MMDKKVIVKEPNENQYSEIDNEINTKSTALETTVKEMVDKCMDPNYKMVPIRYRIHKNSISDNLLSKVNVFIQECLFNPDSEIIFDNDSSRLDNRIILRVPNYTPQMLDAANAVFVGDMRFDLEISLMGLVPFSSLTHPVSIIRWDSFVSGIQLYEKIPVRYLAIEFNSTYIDRLSSEEYAKTITERRELINSSLTRIDKMWQEFNVAM